MEAVGLKTRRVRAQLTAEFTFPKRDPSLDQAIFVRRRAKEMNVIRHDDVGADHPSICCAPCFEQCVVDRRIRELLLALSRANCDKDDRRLTQEDEYAFRGMIPLGQRRLPPRLD